LSLDSMRAILVSNAIALGVVAAAGVPLIHEHGAVGAASTLLAAELTLAACYEVALTRRRPELRLPAAFVARVALAAGAALATALLLDLPPLAMTALGTLVYGAALAALGAVPAELHLALRRRRS
jgi:O-antigen/teichoic acid export membrane protein